MNEESIFAKAIDIDSPDDRRSFVDEACGEDLQLRDRLEALLQGHEKPDSVFDQAKFHQVGESSRPTVPKQLGDFEILGELGRGGMGVVYEARQKSLKRRVALKVLSSGLGLTTKAVMRFRREAEAAAKLHHSNIVPIYSTGEDRGVHFYAMELIDGPALDEVIRESKDHGEQATGHLSLGERSGSQARERADVLGETEEQGAAKSPSRPLPRPTSPATRGEVTKTSSPSTSGGTAHFDTVATMIADAADALDHAHDQGVIHRDIKPSNLLLGPDGRLSINDFGLARVLEQPGMTMSGEFVGTPRYMSPEQITAGRAPLDHRTDIYSLGATLYEMLTLEPAFDGSTRDEVIAQILHKDPQPPRKHNRKIPSDLETICLKAMERDPDRRYPTAGVMAEDLRRFVNRHAISARRVGVFGKTAKWVKRNKSLASVSTLGLLTLLVLGTVLLQSRAEKRRQELELIVQSLDRAKEQAIDAAICGRFDDARNHLETVRRLRGSDGWIQLLEGQIAMQEGDYETARLHLSEAERLLDSTAAFALHTMVLFLSGDEDQYIRRLPGLEKRDAVSFYDRLFKGYAEAWFLDRRALENLNSAVDERPENEMARAIRARALNLSGMAEISAADGLAMIEEAIAELESVRKRGIDTPWLADDLAVARIAAMLRANELNLTDLAKAHEQRAADETSRLLGTLYSSINDTAIELLGLTGQHDRLVSVVKESIKDGQQMGGLRALTAAGHLFRIKQNELALECFSRSPPEVRILTESIRTLIKADAVDADLGELRAGFLRDLTARRDNYSGIYLHLDLAAMRLLKFDRDDPNLVAASKRMEKGYDEYMLESQEGGRRWAEFIRGDCTKEEMLESKEKADHRGMRSGFNFFIAVDYLAEGDRNMARKHFQAVIDDGYFMYFLYRLSLAFLERIDDPKWLPWLPNHADPAAAQPPYRSEPQNESVVGR